MRSLQMSNLRGVMTKNIEYKSREIQDYYSCNRSTWEEFYPSERWVFTKLAGSEGFLGDVLDVGCACGGLGAALSQQVSPDLLYRGGY